MVCEHSPPSTPADLTDPCVHELGAHLLTAAVYCRRCPAGTVVKYENNADARYYSTALDRIWQPIPGDSTLNLTSETVVVYRRTWTPNEEEDTCWIRDDSIRFMYGELSDGSSAGCPPWALLRSRGPGGRMSVTTSLDSGRSRARQLFMLEYTRDANVPRLCIYVYSNSCQKKAWDELICRGPHALRTGELGATHSEARSSPRPSKAASSPKPVEAAASSSSNDEVISLLKSLLTKQERLESMMHRVMEDVATLKKRHSAADAVEDAAGTGKSSAEVHLDGEHISLDAHDDDVRRAQRSVDHWIEWNQRSHAFLHGQTICETGGGVPRAPPGENPNDDVAECGVHCVDHCPYKRVKTSNSQQDLQIRPDPSWPPDLATISNGNSFRPSVGDVNGVGTRSPAPGYSPALGSSAAPNEVAPSWYTH